MLFLNASQYSFSTENSILLQCGISKEKANTNNILFNGSTCLSQVIGISGAIDTSVSTTLNTLTITNNYTGYQPNFIDFNTSNPVEIFFDSNIHNQSRLQVERQTEMQVEMQIDSINNNSLTLANYFPTTVQINGSAPFSIGKEMVQKVDKQQVYKNSFVSAENLSIADTTTKFFDEITLNNKAVLSIFDHGSLDHLGDIKSHQDQLNIKSFNKKFKVAQFLARHFGPDTQNVDTIGNDFTYQTLAEYLNCSDNELVKMFCSNDTIQKVEEYMSNHMTEIMFTAEYGNYQSTSLGDTGFLS